MDNTTTTTGHSEADELAFTLAYARTELIRAWAEIERLHSASPADPGTQARTADKDLVSARINDALGKYADRRKEPCSPEAADA